MPSKKGAKAAEAQAAKAAEAPEEKPAEDLKEEQAVEESEETKDSSETESQANVKKGRGRPKKNDGEPVVKKAKKAKEAHPPTRVSRRVANMKTGETLPDVEDEDAAPAKPPAKKTKKKAASVPAEKQEEASNGATEVATES